MTKVRIAHIRSEEYFDGLINAFCSEYAMREPLAAAIKKNNPGKESESEFVKLVKYKLDVCLKDGLSNVALSEDGDTVVGFIINYKHSSGDKSINDMADHVFPIVQPLAAIIDKLHSMIDIRSALKCSNNRDLLHVGEIFVSKEFEGKGIAGLMIEKSMDLARAANVGCAVAESSSVRSRNVFERHGFSEYESIKPSEFSLNDGSKPFLNVNENVYLMGRLL